MEELYGAGIARKNLAFLEPVVRAIAAARSELAS